ncbi:MAG: hypothetical protein ABI895_43155 [Deltaproteobacteria bacterium]
MDGKLPIEKTTVVARNELCAAGGHDNQHVEWLSQYGDPLLVGQIRRSPKVERERLIVPQADEIAARIIEKHSPLLVVGD